MDSSVLDQFTNKLSNSLQSVFGASSTMTGQNLAVFNKVFDVLDSITNSSSISVDRVNSVLKVYDTMLGQSSDFFNGMDEVSPEIPASKRF